MAQPNAHVPKFGNWDNDGNVPYTQFFENARKGKGGGKMINPNDPAENPEAFSMDIPSAHRPTASSAQNFEGPKVKHERHRSQDGGSDALPRNPYSESPHHRHASDPPRREGRTSGGDYSVEHSPLHPHSQVRADSSDNSRGLISNSGGRSRVRSGARGNETPTRGSAVPKFGAWDEKGPSSADGYTHIFNKVREEKQSQSAKAPAFSKDAAHIRGSKQDDGYGSSSCSCFGWCK